MCFTFSCWHWLKKMKWQTNGGASLKEKKKCSNHSSSVFLFAGENTQNLLHKEPQLSPFKITILVLFFSKLGWNKPNIDRLHLKLTVASRAGKDCQEDIISADGHLPRTVNVKTQKFSPNPVTVLEKCRLRVTHQTSQQLPAFSVHPVEIFISAFEKGTC